MLDKIELDSFVLERKDTMEKDLQNIKPKITLSKKKPVRPQTAI